MVQDGLLDAATTGARALRCKRCALPMPRGWLRARDDVYARSRSQLHCACGCECRTAGHITFSPPPPAAAVGRPPTLSPLHPHA
jgi:hypothetical protein